MLILFFSKNPNYSVRLYACVQVYIETEWQRFDLADAQIKCWISYMLSTYLGWSLIRQVSMLQHQILHNFDPFAHHLMARNMDFLDRIEHHNIWYFL